MSLKKYKELKPAWQALFKEAALKAAAFERKIIRDNEVKQLEELKKLGMEISEVDKALFVEAMAPVYEKFYEKYPAWKEIVEQVRR
jgi:TRAP-type C4-dicarboxylate transport system substrate-binding protein